MTPDDKDTGSVVMTPVPNKPKTPLKSFRIPEDLYRAVQEKAKERGETLTDVVVDAFKRYLRSKR